jgi:ABC-type lipoprotein release transport system permease subunit
MMHELTIMAWRNMWRNWRRTVIAVMAMVLGLILLIFMDGLIKGSDQAIYGNAVRLYGGNLQIHATGFRAKADRFPLLPVENADQVVQIVMAHPEVLVASKRINTGGMINERGESYPITITGIEASAEAPISLIAENISEGRFIQDDDKDMIVIGKGLADSLNVSIDDRVTLMGKRKNESMRQRTMTIVGIYDLGLKEAEKGMVFISLSEAQSLFNLRDQETEVTVSTISVGNEDQLINELQANLLDYEVDSWETLNPEIRQTMDIKSQFTTIFGLIVVMIACIGILNLMMMAVFERTREMGVLAALGMKGRQIMGLFLLEGTMIGVVSAIGGCLLGWLVLILFNRSGGFDLTFTQGMGDITALMGDAIFASISFESIARYGVIVAGMAALASLFPAWQASQKEPAKTLHYV